ALYENGMSVYDEFVRCDYDAIVGRTDVLGPEDLSRYHRLVDILRTARKNGAKLTPYQPKDGVINTNAYWIMVNDANKAAKK
ncbi:MAG: hypothetical protein IJ680_05125, partial [Paludibacteraceae bacterium]|nr:hypothetical protein [Paludibacteraceae bacterium]